VLVATDFSKHGDAAIERAALLPLARGATVDLLHVTHKPVGRPDRRLQDDVRGRLDALAERFRTLAEANGSFGLRLRPRVVAGTPFVEIVRRARLGQADLIVVGRHGARTFRDLMIGSTAERVLRKGGPSVLVTGGKASQPYRRPMVAIDTSDVSAHALVLAWRVVDPALEELAVAHVPAALSILGRLRVGPGSRVPDTRLREIEEFLARMGPAGQDVRIVLGEGDPRAGVLALAKKENADLLVLGTHARVGVQRMLLGSVAEAVTRSANCDVLLVRPRRYTFRHP
jgi:universal stress protein E